MDCGQITLTTGIQDQHAFCQTRAEEAKAKTVKEYFDGKKLEIFKTKADYDKYLSENT